MVRNISENPAPKWFGPRHEADCNNSYGTPMTTTRLPFHDALPREEAQNEPLTYSVILGYRRKRLTNFLQRRHR
jgi:hypothetical protein